MDVAQKFLETVEKYHMIKKGDSIMAGVSGGPDSVCLLHLLKRFQKQLQIKLCVAHLDHMFRGRESEEDALFVEKLCESWHIPFFKDKIDVPKYIKRTGLSPEDAARRVRYAFFERARGAMKADKVALGHNRNDHEETVLMNILRGSGVEGLVGIEPVRDFYIRPLLEVSRDEIEGYLKKEGLNYRIDRTNLSPHYFRNKLRLELIPLIEKKYAPHIGASLRRLSEIARYDISFLEEETGKAWQDVASYENGKVCVDIKKFSNLHEALKRRLVRKAVEKLVGNMKDFEYRHTSMLVDFIVDAGAGSTISLPRNLEGEKEYDFFYLHIKTPEKTSNFSYSLPIPGKIFIPEAGVTLEACLEDKSHEIIRTNPLIAQLDYDKIKGNLTVRNRKPGDRFIPIGGHYKKIQDFFTDEKVPRKRRDSVPILLDEEKILWVCGMRIDDRVKVTDDTKTILFLKMERREDYKC